MRNILIADTRLAGTAAAFNANCKAALRWIDEAGADLVVHLGDVTANGVFVREHFTEARAIFADLQTPVRFLPGNHDIGDNPREGQALSEPVVVSGHAHQWRRFSVAGVDHVWAPSNAFVIPDLMQETIGEKRVGLLILTLEDGRHDFALHVPAGMRRHDLADHPEVYPELPSLLAALRASAAASA